MLHCNIVVVATVISGGSLREPGFRLPPPESRRLRGRWWSQQTGVIELLILLQSLGEDGKAWQSVTMTGQGGDWPRASDAWLHWGID